MFPRSDTPEPDADVLPRTRLQGGFIIERKVKPYGSRFSFVGEELYAEFMVVTQRAVFRKGYLGMDPAKIPQFEEGEREKVAGDLLEAEGLDHLKFATRLD
ncbi:hypothetical protein EDD85DRAFT_948004 [Armillaria nabsnona]|nr:hypothetical protein EDD85DRAFT_948004 [Armillaria nabsnona]